MQLFGLADNVNITDPNHTYYYIKYSDSHLNDCIRLLKSKGGFYPSDYLNEDELLPEKNYLVYIDPFDCTIQIAEDDSQEGKLVLNFYIEIYLSDKEQWVVYDRDTTNLLDNILYLSEEKANIAAEAARLASGFKRNLAVYQIQPLMY